MAILLFISIYKIFPIHSHWAEIYRPATLHLLAGKNPYIIEGFLNPPWALIPLIPMAILPERVGNALLGTITIIAFGYTAHKLGAKPLTIILFLTLPVTLYNIIQVNVDWLVGLGLLLPPQLGLFFVLLKPQIGIFIALYWLYQAWESGGIKEVFKIFSPVTFAFLLSLIIFGGFVQKSAVVFHDPNLTYWPESISAGFVVFALAFRMKKANLSITAAPLLTPYIQPYSLPLAAFGLLPDSRLTNLFLIGLWAIYLQPSRRYIFNRLFQPLIDFFQ